MPDQSAAERTEQPTARRLQKARSKGNVPQIQELVSVVTLLALIVTIAMTSHQLADWATALTREGLSCQTRFFTNGDAFINFINAKIIDSMVICLPILAAIVRVRDSGEHGRNRPKLRTGGNHPEIRRVKSRFRTATAF